jgi:uncharacterized integral membrane protein
VAEEEAARERARRERIVQYAEWMINMEMKGHKRKEFRELLNSLKLGKTFGRMLLWELLLVGLVFAGIYLWAHSMKGLEPMVQQATAPFYGGTMDFTSALSLQDPKVMVKELQTRVIAYTALILIYLLFVWSFFKCLTYIALLGKKLNAKLYGKFFLGWVCWAVLLAAVIYLVQLAFYKTLFYSLPYRAASRITLLVGSVLFFMLLCYFTITFFIHLTKSEKFKEALKEYFRTNIKGIRHFIIPFLLTLLVFIVVNILMHFVSWLPRTISFVINLFIMLAYIVWLKLYYSSCIERLSKHKHEEHKPKAKSKVIKHSVRKQ